MIQKILSKRVSIKVAIIAMIAAELGHMYLDNHFPHIF